MVKDPKNIEQCVITKMNDYKTQSKKEYFECSYNEIISEIAKCIIFYEETYIDTKPDITINEISRQNSDIFDPNKVMTVRIIDDEEFDKLFDIESDTESSNSDYDSDENTIGKHKQKGGSYNKYSYLKYKLKYLELRYDLL